MMVSATLLQFNKELQQEYFNNKEKVFQFFIQHRQSEVVPNSFIEF